MKNLILAAGLAAFAFAAPAVAGPGKGNSRHGTHVGKAHMGKSHKSDARRFSDANQGQGYGVRGCPPGLAKQPRCMPPGQYKQQFGVGQRVPFGYDRLLGYDALPRDLRNRYGNALDPRSRYIYDNSYLYRVDPQTMLVRQVLGALIR